MATDKLKITLATYNFVGDVEIWWNTISHTHNLDTMTYAKFKKLYYEKYFSAPKRRELKKEFDWLKQGNMTVTKYENKFMSLLRPIVAASELTGYAKAVQKALVVDAESKDSKAIRESYKYNRGMSAFSKGQSSKKQKHEQSGFRGQQSARSIPTVSVSIESSRPNVTCFRYGHLGHYKSQCTQAQAHVLFDSGASYSFIASSFARVLGLEVSQVDRPLCVDTPLRRVCRGSITNVGRVLEFNLILLKMTGFDVILGMDWLLSFRVVINCFRGRVSMCTPDGDCFCFVRDRCDSLTLSFYNVRGPNRQGFFLANLFADEDIEFCGVNYPVVVRDFLDVFPEDLTELPPHREMEVYSSGVHWLFPQFVIRTFYENFTLLGLQFIQWKWEEIAMDFVTGLPRSRRENETIWVIIDRLTKNIHFLPIKVTDDAEALGVLYVKEIVRLHEVPVAIVSNRDAKFTSKFWERL
ncbi:uncharacterized protein LOC132304710 [Cornus florida]|uniref:uncharacterized protein LOC132304710 n=1 Tax=Cornus florida TaxID=4283 RepID=UPI00289FF678|nr:uncharacterized protein LOC132304710 [Cornus florida]